MRKSITLLLAVAFTLLISELEGKPAEIYHHYISRGDCSEQDENDVNLEKTAIKEYDVEKSPGFDAKNCPRCSIDETYERGVHGEFISCKCVRNSNGLVHGDEKVDDRNRDQMNHAFGYPTRERAAITGDRYKWPNVNGEVKVPYELKGTFAASEDMKARFFEAIESFKKRTCIRFVQRTTEKDYILPVDEQGCWSFIGKVGGEQKVSIGSRCQKIGIVMHEMMHSLGFYHEQSRKDRDKYVTVNMNNVLSVCSANCGPVCCDTGQYTKDCGSCFSFPISED